MRGSANLPPDQARAYISEVQAQTQGDEIIPTDIFFDLFFKGVELHDLLQFDIAAMFSASEPTVDRWRNREAAPAPGYRRLALGKLAILTHQKLHSHGYPTLLDQDRMDLRLAQIQAAPLEERIDMLKRVGILTADGKLAPEYGGDG